MATIAGLGQFALGNRATHGLHQLIGEHRLELLGCFPLFAIGDASWQAICRVFGLVTWADVIRKTFADGGCDEVISTRRLVHIVETFGIFGDKMKAISLCLNRFDDDTKASFLDLYTKVDAGANTEVILASTITAKENPDEEQEEDEDVPF